jgi:hypothetical protein
MNSEPKLCPDCPARGWIPDMIKRLKEKEIIKTGQKPSTLKICMELRKIIKDLGLPSCPYYPESENLKVYLKASE